MKLTRSSITSFVKKRQRALFLSIAASFLLLSLGGCMESRIVLADLKEGTNYEKALNAYLRGNFSQAKQFADKVQKEERDYKSAQLLKEKATNLADRIVTKYLEIGDLYEGAGIMSEAEDAYKGALSVNPDSDRAKRKLNRLNLREKEKFIQIKETPSLAGNQNQAKQKVDVQKLYDEGAALYKGSKYSLALEKFHEVLKNDPSFKNTNELVVAAKKKRKEFVSFHLKEGIHHYQQENLQAAIKEWDLVLSEEPSNPTALNYKMKAESIMKKLQEISNGGKKQ